ncbi:hypothetical protein ACH518_06765 [Methylomonas sp. HW2-6]|uniref:hypothetical protein n=1 Tax=Methylomonas sp. HW2-6 TaxID=3376687 RepID=UPI0040438484
MFLRRFFSPSPQSSHVFIPLKNLSRHHHTLLEIYAEDQPHGGSTSDREAKAVDKGWNIVAAPLMASGLYADGLSVVNAIRRFPLQPAWSILGWTRRANWLDRQRLYVASQPENIEGDSAQLGLAIALLMNGSAGPHRFAIATGRLNGGRFIANDIGIDEVNGIPEKLDIVIDACNIGRFPKQALYFFTPKTFSRNDEKIAVLSLPQIGTLQALGITVCAIDTLSEAQKWLGAHRLRISAAERRINLVAKFTAVLLGLWLTGYAWLQTPIDLKLLAPKVGMAKAPFLVCTSDAPNGRSVKYLDLPRDGSMPLLPLLAENTRHAEVRLGLLLRAEDSLLPIDYYLALVNYGEKTGLNIMSTRQDSPPPNTIRIGPGQATPLEWVMKEPAQAENDVFIVLIQHLPFSASEIESQFHSRFPYDGPPPSVSAVMNFFQADFPVGYSFFYQSSNDDPTCINR